ncbi:TPA: hypothetical protein ACGAD2_005227 [Salmonella enterica subsp. enterica serovar Newport]
MKARQRKKKARVSANTMASVKISSAWIEKTISELMAVLNEASS